MVPFPFSDLTKAKRRPALVVAELEGDDLILCQITSQQISDRYSIRLEDGDFDSGALRQSSHIRPNRLFTADRQIILYRIGHIKSSKIGEVTKEIVTIFQR